MIQKSCSNINQPFVHDELLLFLGNCTTLFINVYVIYARKLTGCSPGHLFNDHFCSLDCNFKLHNLHIAFHSFLYVIIMEWQLCCS